MAITNAQQYKQLMQKGGRTGYRDAGFISGRTKSKRSSNTSSPREKGIMSRGKGPGGTTGKITNIKDKEPDRGAIGGENKRLDKLIERKKFIYEPANYGKFTPGYLKFAADLSREPNRKFFINKFMQGPNAGKLVQDVLGLDEDGLSFSPSNLTEEQYEKVYQTQMKNRLSGEVDAMGNPMPFTGGGIDAKSAGAERGDITTLPLVQDKVIDEEEEKDPTAYRFLADGGRAAFQEGGGIFPRLNQLGSNVSSAEQELAALNSKIDSAESTLGEGGGDEGGLGSIMPENNFTNPTLEAFSGTNIPVKGGAEAFANVPDRIQIDPNFKPSGTLQATTGSGDLFGLFNKGLSDARQPPKGLTPGTPMQLGNSAPSTNLPGSGAPQAGDVVYDPTGMPNIYAPRNGYADGGMSEYEGGIMDLESGRQQYFLGKLVKKAKKTIGKIYKSPLGKAALLGLGAQGLMSGKGLGIKDFLTRSFLGKETSGMGNRSGGILEFIKNNKALTGIAAGSLAAGLMTPKQSTYDAEEEDEFYLDRYRADPEKYLATRFLAEGGRIGYSSGSEDLSKNKVYQKWVQRYEANPDSPLVTMHEKADVFKNFYERNKNAQAEGSKEPVAKETMPLLDMDGEEMDLRAEGGFVPIGRMEKADDVPARLSKNEFVFTADAVRNAGEGDVDKGAEVMYNMMKNLEAGGEVSEESQGLEGAKRMFQTSQRLEEVL